MIISRIDGGLGNQMFQYAFGAYLARKHGTEHMLDISSYATLPQHGYLLDKFKIDAPIADKELLGRLPRKYRPDDANVDRGYFPSLFQGTKAIRRVKEKPFGFHSRYLDTPDQRYLVGYWQSEKFFPDLRDELLRRFELAEAPSEQSRAVAERMSKTNSVAMHIRRGDYISSQSAASIYERLDLEYYRQSLASWARSKKGVEVYVFSNDMEWCRANLNLSWKTHWIDHNSIDTAHEDMWLMSKAATTVIANSTFSWWSAWLNQRQDHRVFAPSRWFRNGTMDDKDILCEHWCKTELSPVKKVA